MGAIWFPWNKRGARNRKQGAFPSPENLHERFIERLRAGKSYRQIYAAAFKHDPRPALAALTVPATFMVQAHDPLFRHLDRLPGLKKNQHIARYPSDGVDYVGECARVLRAYRTKTKPPVETTFRPTPGVINRRYVDLADGQILVRSAGEARRARPLLLLHEGRASSRLFEHLMRVLATSRPVYAPDLPDNGASDPLVSRRPRIEDYVAVVEGTVRALGLTVCDIYAVGAGAPVALELQRRSAFSKSSLLLETPDSYAPNFARRLARAWAPPLTPQWDAAHLNSLWLMLRDEYAFWPWFDKSVAAGYAVDAPGDGQALHARATDILRSLSTYHRLTAAALRYDWQRPLRRAGKRRVKLAVASGDPRRPHAEAAAQFAQLPAVAILPPALEAKAGLILKLLTKSKR